ncbi:MAG: hypothetical protein AB7V50_10200 [Vampirovibrionia bacterium]
MLWNYLIQISNKVKLILQKISTLDTKSRNNFLKKSNMLMESSFLKINNTTFYSIKTDINQFKALLNI